MYAAGGSLRIYRRDVQAKVFNAIGLSEADAKAKFGYLLDAFDSGAPPHGGIAFGLDRLVMLLAGAAVCFRVQDHQAAFTDACKPPCAAAWQRRLGGLEDYEPLA